MLVKINYQRPNADGTFSPVVRLIKDALILSVDPHPEDATRSIMRIGFGDTPGSIGNSSAVINESITQYATRYATAATSNAGYLDLNPANVAPPVAGGKLVATVNPTPTPAN